MAEVLFQLVRFEVHSGGIGPDILSTISNNLKNKYLKYEIAVNRIKHYFRVYLRRQTCSCCGHSTHWRNDYTCWCKYGRTTIDDHCHYQKDRFCCKRIKFKSYSIIDGPYEINGATRELIDGYSGNYGGDYMFHGHYNSLEEYWKKVDDYYKNKSKYKYDPDCFEEKYPL